MKKKIFDLVLGWAFDYSPWLQYQGEKYPVNEDYPNGNNIGRSDSMRRAYMKGAFRMDEEYQQSIKEWAKANGLNTSKVLYEIQHSLTKGVKTQEN